MLAQLLAAAPEACRPVLALSLPSQLVLIQDESVDGSGNFLLHLFVRAGCTLLSFVAPKHAAAAIQRRLGLQPADFCFVEALSMEEAPLAHVASQLTAGSLLLLDGLSACEASQPQLLGFISSLQQQCRSKGASLVIYSAAGLQPWLDALLGSLARLDEAAVLLACSSIDSCSRADGALCIAKAGCQPQQLLYQFGANLSVHFRLK